MCLGRNWEEGFTAGGHSVRSRVDLPTWRQKLGCNGKVIAGKKIRRKISAKSRTSDRTGV